MAGKGGERSLGPKQREESLETLKARFEGHMNRHRDLQWASVRSRLESRPEGLWSLSEMERTGGEPDVVGRDGKTGEYLFYDCSAESPKGRRSVCYDAEALEARKEHKPANSAVAMANAMGAALLTEEECRGLQRLGEFDTKTSSWLLTPSDIRRRGGAVFADYRYGHVFVYHNGAESYYAARGFRCVLRVQPRALEARLEIEVVVRAALPTEQKLLESLQWRASLANPGDRAALLAHADAVDLPLEQIAAGGVFVAEAEGSLVGFAAILSREDDDSELDALFVEPHAWRRGIGRALVEHCAAVARTSGAESLCVLGNPHAQSFYAACGFRTLGTEETRFGPALVMRRALR